MEQQTASAEGSNRSLKVWPVDVDAPCEEEGCTERATHKTDVELDLFDSSITRTIQPAMCEQHARHYARMFDNWT